MKLKSVADIESYKENLPVLFLTGVAIYKQTGKQGMENMTIGDGSQKVEFYRENVEAQVR